jgi:hypothetical protein
MYSPSQELFLHLYFCKYWSSDNLRGINFHIYIISCWNNNRRFTITKLVGCRLPAMLFLRCDKSRAMRVGIGMISRGEVGLM